ncbi:MAG: permease prefix domain 1-containing protein [Victivallaceae bacterium]|nr:permease prefix domain 1-containing protein [Victivallaceae bacterium]
MDKAKLEKLLDDLTAGLKADPEIRLDVRSELRSHLEEKIEENIRSGLSEAESEKQALKAFGDPVRISDGIAAANTDKMSLRGKLRVLAGALLIPAVVICAFITFNPAKLQVNFTPEHLRDITAGNYGSGPADRNKTFWFLEKYTPDEKLILYGDKSRKSRAEQQKVIWKHFPENKVYLANYVISLLDDRNKDQAAWKETLTSALETAKLQEPDNALYDYITAGLLVESGCEIGSKRKRVIRDGKETVETEYCLAIKDRKLMDKAVEAYLAGTRKKYYRSYVTDMLRYRLDIMGKPRNITENIRQIAVSAGTLLPHLQYFRNTVRGVWKYAEILQKEGNQREALRIVAPWKIFLKQITEDAGFLIDVLVDAALAAVGEKIIPEIYRKAGEIKSAVAAGHVLGKILEPSRIWKAEVKESRLDQKVFEKAGVMAGMLLPALGKIDYAEENFAVSKKIEYTALEKFGAVLLNTLFMIGMTGALLTALYWRLRSGRKALLLAPSAGLVGKVLFLGIILPLTAYFLISVSGILGGHEYNIRSNCIALSAQFIIVLAAVPALIFVMIRKHIRRRCRELDIAYPESTKSKIDRVVGAVAIIFFFIFAILPLRYFTPRGPLLSIMTIGLVGAGIAAGCIIIPLVRYLLTIFSDGKYALYYGALAKTLAPVLALAMIFITLLIIPYLEWREADLIGRDRVIYGQPRSFSHVEDQVTRRLKTAMLKAME